MNQTHSPSFTLIFFFYGLAFFCLGLVVFIEMGRGSDERLRYALKPLAFFGLLHGFHEWLEMFLGLGFTLEPAVTLHQLETVRIALLVASFLPLAAFGAAMLAPEQRVRLFSVLIPAVLLVLFSLGVVFLRGRFGGHPAYFQTLDAWTRYILAVPGAVLASAGLAAQRRTFQRSGLRRFGRDSLVAAVAFFVYGVVGQMFPHASPLPPAHLLNQARFEHWFGFPVQLLRAGAAFVVTMFVARFLRAFEVETQGQINALREARLEEAERRQALRGELLRRVVNAQEAERQRIARELHDETGQALTAVGLGLRGIASTLRVDADRAAGNLRQMEGLVAHSLTELQRLIADLRPSHLDQLGLAAALRWYAGEVEARSQLKVQVEVLGQEGPLSSPVKTTLFRVVQEALTNVVKHAGAGGAWITVRFEADRVSVSIRDDGCGFEVGMIEGIHGPAWGLAGMRERTELLDGHLRVRSEPGAGTTVEVTLPYQQPELKEVHNGHHTPVSG